LKIGRNDPCPCGSGKKYKNCCLKSNVVNLHDVRLEKEKEILIPRFLDYLQENWNPKIMGYANQIVDESLSTNEEQILTEDLGIIIEAFGFHKKLNNGRTPFQQFLERKGREFHPQTVEFFRKYEEIYYSFYRVQDYTDDSFIFVDMLMEGKSHLVLKEDFMQNLEIGDQLYCQLVPFSDSKLMILASYIILNDVEYMFYEELKQKLAGRENTYIEQYLKENAFDITLNLIRKNHDMEEIDDNEDIEDIEELFDSQINTFVYFWLREQRKDLGNLTPLEAFHHKKFRKKLLQIIDNPENLEHPEQEMLPMARENLLKQLGLGEIKLKRANEYKWPGETYALVAELIENELQDSFSPLEIHNAVKMWWDFLQLKQPRIIKPTIWVAVMEYILTSMHFNWENDLEIAEKYGISRTTIKKNYNLINNLLVLENNDDYRAYGSMTFLENLIDGFEAINKAEELIDLAWETNDLKKRRQLAQEALQLDPLAVDAYVILGNAANTYDEAMMFYEQGVQAGEEIFGEEYFQENTGHFWGLIETRPYMRAKYGLAQSLLQLGKGKEAVQHFWEMLKLNPNDNQGIRYELSHILIKHNDDVGFKKLLSLYPDDDGIELVYNEALFFFNKYGESKKANEKLKYALNRNPHVVDYLLDSKKVPQNIPDYYTLGSKEEAIVYVQEGKQNWNNTKGAIPWLMKYYFAR